MYYIKLFKQGIPLEAQEINRLNDKKSEYFYFKQNDYLVFLADLIKEMTELSAIQKGEIQPIFEGAAAVHHLAQSLVKKLGISPETAILIKSAVNLALGMFKKNPSLYNLLKLTASDDNDYLGSHSVIVGYIASSLASLIGLKSERIFFNLALSLFLHDITLTHQNLAKISTLTELENEKNQFSAGEIHQFKVHPTEAAALAQSIAEIPNEIRIIILQHHERPDGTGFPKNLRADQIIPIASIFIVAENLTCRIITPKDRPDLNTCLLELATEYPEGLFKKIIQTALNNSIPKDL